MTTAEDGEREVSEASKPDEAPAMPKWKQLRGKDKMPKMRQA